MSKAVQGKLFNTLVASNDVIIVIKRFDESQKHNEMKAHRRKKNGKKQVERFLLQFKRDEYQYFSDNSEYIYNSCKLLMQTIFI